MHSGSTRAHLRVKRVYAGPNRSNGCGLHVCEGSSALQNRARAGTFPSVRKWDNLSLRIAVYYVQVIAEERITRTEQNAGRNRISRVSGWRERCKTKLPIVGRDSESSFKPSERQRADSRRSAWRPFCVRGVGSPV